MIPYDASRMPSDIPLGYLDENHWRPQLFDCASLLENHPEGIMTLWVQPQGAARAFPVALEHGEDDVYIWTPLDEEITAQNGKLQLMCVDGTDVGKSAVSYWHVGDSIVPGAEHPADVPSWAAETIRRSEDAAKRAEEAAESIDIDPEAVAQAVADYLDKHPITAPVTSVNGQTGTVDLSASDVGALPADTPIPAAVTEQTVSGWGFTKNTGTYSKPSGGIPASDLAPGVIPVVPQMATQTDMSDWTSGKTVDAVTLRTNFVQAMTLLGGKASQTQVDALASALDDVQTAVSGKANISDIPTAVSELTNDSGFQTAAQVQSAIAAIPDELPAVTSSDNGKFLRVVSGAWSVQAVPAAESASFGGGS